MAIRRIGLAVGLDAHPILPQVHDTRPEVLDLPALRQSDIVREVTVDDTMLPQVRF
jgi:hypothetical protein